MRPPGRPTGEPIADNVGVKSLVLKYGKPNDDGGSPIEEYRIECRSVDVQSWTEMGLSETTELLIRDLTENTEYFFRVSARNKVQI